MGREKVSKYDVKFYNSLMDKCCHFGTVNNGWKTFNDYYNGMQYDVVNGSSLIIGDKLVYFRDLSELEDVYAKELNIDGLGSKGYFLQKKIEKFSENYKTKMKNEIAVDQIIDINNAVVDLQRLSHNLGKENAIDAYLDNGSVPEEVIDEFTNIK